MANFQKAVQPLSQTKAHVASFPEFVACARRRSCCRRPSSQLPVEMINDGSEPKSKTEHLPSRAAALVHSKLPPIHWSPELSAEANPAGAIPIQLQSTLPSWESASSHLLQRSQTWFLGTQRCITAWWTLSLSSEETMFAADDPDDVELAMFILATCLHVTMACVELHIAESDQPRSKHYG